MKPRKVLRSAVALRGARGGRTTPSRPARSAARCRSGGWRARDHARKNNAKHRSLARRSVLQSRHGSPTGDAADAARQRPRCARRATDTPGRRRTRANSSRDEHLCAPRSRRQDVLGRSVGATDAPQPRSDTRAILRQRSWRAAGGLRRAQKSEESRDCSEAPSHGSHLAAAARQGLGARRRRGSSRAGPARRRQGGISRRRHLRTPAPCRSTQSKVTRSRRISGAFRTGAHRRPADASPAPRVVAPRPARPARSVFARVKPLPADTAVQDWAVDDKAVTQARHGCKKEYHLDQVFPASASTSDVYQSTTAPLVRSVIDGFNCTVFAYGQTGSGKTHTMRGAASDGVIPRAVADLFRHIAEQTSRDFLMRISYMEVRCAAVAMLLRAGRDAPSAPLPARCGRREPEARRPSGRQRCRARTCGAMPAAACRC